MALASKNLEAMTQLNVDVDNGEKKTVNASIIFFQASIMVTGP